MISVPVPRRLTVLHIFPGSEEQISSSSWYKNGYESRRYNAGYNVGILSE